MTTDEIAVFLEDTRVQIQQAIDESFRPKYKSDTWLKQKDLQAVERIIMQLVDNKEDDVFSNKWLVEQTGFSSKCIRENLAKLIKKHIVKKVGCTHNYTTVKIF